MKKSLLALAALTAFAGAASAQSSVTLFGSIDLSVNRIKNGTSSQTLMQSNQLNSNRIGFRGVEDLGGGLRAGFWIEGGMNNDDGTGTTGGAQDWRRRSTVSLIGGFGEVRLGRDYVAPFSNRASFDPFGFNGVGHMGNVESTLASGAQTQVRASNMVGYFLPAMGGLYGQVQVAAGEGNASSTGTGNKFVGARLGYAAGPFNVGASYGKTYKTGTMVDQFTTGNVGASFDLGFLKLSGSYNKVDYGRSDQTTYLVGLSAPFGASTFKASFNKASGKINTQTGAVALVQDVSATEFAFGYQYDLSKRTALYATVAKIDNDGNATTGARFFVQPLNGIAMTPGGNSTGYNFDVRHSF